MQPSMDLLQVKIEDIVPTYTKENNPNQMTPLEFDALVALMRAKGAVQTILLWKKEGKKGGTKYMLHDGHHRLWAAQKINEDEPGKFKVLPAIAYNSKGEAEAALIGLGLNRIRGEQDLARAGNVMQEIIEKAKVSLDMVSLLTGYGVEELEALTSKASDDADDLLEELENAGGSDLDEDEEVSLNAKPYVLEITFTDKEKFKLAKRRLRKAAGKSKDLATGLLSLLGEDDAE